MTLQPTSHPSTKAAGLDRHQYTILFLGLPVLSLGTFSIIYKKWPYPHGYALTWHGVCLLQCHHDVIVSLINVARPLDICPFSGYSCRSQEAAGASGSEVPRSAEVPMPKGCRSITGKPFHWCRSYVRSSMLPKIVRLCPAASPACYSPFRRNMVPMGNYPHLKCDAVDCLHHRTGSGPHFRVRPRQITIALDSLSQEI